jgi:hypothetical protein
MGCGGCVVSTQVKKSYSSSSLYFPPKKKKKDIYFLLPLAPSGYERQLRTSAEVWRNRSRVGEVFFFFSSGST